MRFSEYFRHPENPVISLELFPPKNKEARQGLHRVLPGLAALRPSYMTVTCGAMGSTRDNTLETAAFIKNKFDIEAACHLTCVGTSRAELRDTLKRTSDAGIQNIVALRGDPPEGDTDFVPPTDGLAHANELVAYIRYTEEDDSPFGIAVAGYPEKHIEAESLEADIANLKRKVEAGGDIVITQLFYDNAFYFDYVERLRAAGIEAPVVPGLMPIRSVAQIRRITSMCGATLPADLMKKLETAINDDRKARRIGTEQCIRQATELLEQGAPGIHFYVLNRLTQIREIIQSLPLPQRVC